MRRMPVERGDGARPCLYGRVSSTFAEIESLEADPSAAFSVLRFCQQWVSEHVGANLKSLNFLFTCGLF